MKKIIFGILALIAFIILMGSFTTVDTGYRGIVYNFGQIDRVLTPGFHGKNPFTESVDDVNVFEQKEQVNADAASKDLQKVSAVVALNYQVDDSKIVELYRQIGPDYKTKVIDPAVQEAVKGATAKYTAEELITKRELVRDDIKSSLKERLKDSFIITNEVSIVNFDFSPSFNAAIESKVTAEQNALAAKNKLDQVKFEADQKVATAEAEAKSIRLQSDAANNEKYVALKQIEVQLEQAKRWNGVLPVNVYGSAPIPFLNLSK